MSFEWANLVGKSPSQMSDDEKAKITRRVTEKEKRVVDLEVERINSLNDGASGAQKNRQVLGGFTPRMRELLKVSLPTIEECDDENRSSKQSSATASPFAQGTNRASSRDIASQPKLSMLMMGLAPP